MEKTFVDSSKLCPFGQGFFFIDALLLLHPGAMSSAVWRTTGWESTTENLAMTGNSETIESLETIGKLVYFAGSFDTAVDSSVRFEADNSDTRSADDKCDTVSETGTTACNFASRYTEYPIDIAVSQERNTADMSGSADTDSDTGQTSDNSSRRRDRHAG